MSSLITMMRLLGVLLCCCSLSTSIMAAGPFCEPGAQHTNSLIFAMHMQQRVSQLSPDKRVTYLEALRLKRKFNDEAIVNTFKIDVIDLLVFSGADVNQRETSTGRTLLHKAVLEANSDVINWLAQDNVADFDIKDNDNMTSLDLAFQGRKTDIFDILAKNGAKVMSNERDDDGNPPLHVVVSRNNVGYVSTIVQYNLVDLKITNHDGESALHTAVKNTFHRFDINVFSLLAKCDADVINIQDNKGNTVLHVAATQNYFDHSPVQTLVDCLHLNLNTQNYEGNTALHLAVQYAQVNTLNILLSVTGRLDHELQNDEDETAQDIANRGQDQSVTLLTKP